MTGKIGSSRMKRTLAIAVVMAALLLLVGSLASSAQGPQRTTLDPDDVNAPNEIYEVGTEWIANFTQCPANNIACEEPQCMGFYDELVNAGWGGNDSFHWGNCNAWAEDFKRSAVGGNENDWIDDVDIALFCDHGTTTYDSFWNQYLSALHFGCKDPDGDCNVSPGEAYLSYGDNDLEWLAFKACSVLSDGGPAPFFNRGYWAATMDNLHLLLGFKNSSYCDSDFGEAWAEYMLGWRFLWWWIRPPYKVTQAWFEAVDDTQPGGVCARVLAEESYFFNDYLWGRGYVYPDYQDGDYTYWDHCSCTPPAVQLGEDVLQQIETLPVLEVVPRTINEDYVLEIAAAFGMASTEVYSDTGYFYLIDATDVETYTLQVDKVTGGYKYRNASELWSTPVEPPALPLGDEALRLGNEFFAGDGANLPAAAYRTGETLINVEEQIEVEEMVPGATIQEEVVLSTLPVNVALSYGRLIDVQASTERGTQQVSLSVVGPGGRTKMYFGDGGLILGVQGGSRDLKMTGQNVTIMDANKVWDLFLADPSISLIALPWVYDQVERLGETLGYYEQSYTEQQTEIIPSWIFSATFSNEGQVQAEGVFVYVPASADYLPPEVQIDAPLPGDTFSPSEPLVLEGSVVQFGQAPFTYEWYSSFDGYLGEGAILETTVSPAVAKGVLAEQTITLYVTDANGQQGTDTVDVFVRAGTYLPLVVKNE